MNRQTVIDLLNAENAADMEVTGTHQTRNGLRFETLNTQAGMRIYYRLKAFARRTDAKGCKVVCGETNNGSCRFFVRIGGLSKD